MTMTLGREPERVGETCWLPPLKAAANNPHTNKNRFTSIVLDLPINLGRSPELVSTVSHSKPVSLTDPDAKCDPESATQVSRFDANNRADPGDHPRDFWIVDAALEILAREAPI